MKRTATRRPVGDELFGGRLKDAFYLDLEVVEIVDSTPRLRTVTFRSTDLIDFEWAPGQDVMLTVPADPSARRRYSIRRADAAAGTLDIDVVLHGAGLFASWARAAAVGDHVEGIGPRGVIGLREDAAHHVFVCDESAIGATFAMLEALPAGAAATGVIATADPATTPHPPSTRADVDLRWTSVDGVNDELRSVDLQGGTVAYVNGERTLVRDATEVLVGGGLARDDVYGKAYWRRDRANAAHGEPPKD